MANYEELIETINACPPGAVLEIGAFIGEGTAKLCATGRQVIVIDTFDPDSDSNTGCKELYRRWLGGRDMRSVFLESTAGVDNLVCITLDSALIHDLGDARLAFSFIDGAHDFDHVWHDFRLAYQHTVPGGWICFHDYQNDLPEVTRAVDNILKAFPELKVRRGKSDITLYVQIP